MMKKFIQSVMPYAMVVMLICSAYLTSGEQFTYDEYTSNFVIHGSRPIDDLDED